MIRPPFLKTGDKVCIVAPGRKIDEDVIQRAIVILQGWGLAVKVSNNIFSNRHSYLAGSDEERQDDFQDALDDKTVRAIICARGGYGSTRIIDTLDYEYFKKQPKWIAGFSDITAFHLKAFSLGIQSIHSTMPILFSKEDNARSLNSLRHTLFGAAETLTATHHVLNRLGTGDGLLVGGNLSLVLDSIGTSSEPDFTNVILFIEEISEYLYKIDRMFVQLKRAGKLAKLSGLMIGHFTDVLDTELRFGETVEEIITNHVKEYNFPVAFNFRSGHNTPNLAWRSGAKTKLDVTGAQSSLVYLD